jgi:multiple sugar transport system substrate-binding protein
MNTQTNAKKAALAVLLIAVICIFAACSKRQPSDGGQTKIRVASWDAGTSVLFIDLTEAFRQAHPGIGLEIIDIPAADYEQKLQIMLNGGSDVDVFFIRMGDTTKGMFNRGQLADLSAYLSRDNVSLADFNGLADRYVFDGQVAALPTRFDYYVNFYNKGIFDKAGIPYPSNDMTWAEWEGLAGRLASDRGNNKVYGALFMTWPECVWNWAIQDGRHTIMDTDYSFFKPYYEMALRMQKAGSLYGYGDLRSGGIHYSSAFFQGNVAMLPMGTWFSTGIIDRVNSNETDIRWGIATLPHAPDIESGWTVGSVTPIAMNKSSRKKDTAWEFINFVTGKEGAEIYAKYGQFPGRADGAIMETIAAGPGMPEGSLEALAVKNLTLDRPMADQVAEVRQMLDREHSLIMLGEVSIDRGIENMSKRSKEIQSAK